MENFVVNGGVIFGLIGFGIAFIFYIMNLKTNKKCLKLQKKEIKQDGLLNNAAAIIFPEKSIGFNEIGSRGFLKRLRKITREHKDMGYDVLELTGMLEGKENILQHVRSESTKKNLVISKQKRRILEFEVASYFVGETAHKKPYFNALAMLRKMTIKELEHEKSSWEKPKKVCKATKNK